MLNEASLTDVMEPVGAIFLSRTALKEKLFHSGGLMQLKHPHLTLQRVETLISRYQTIGLSSLLEPLRRSKAWPCDSRDRRRA